LFFYDVLFFSFFFQTAWHQSLVVVEKTAIKATDAKYGANLMWSMTRAHTRLMTQAGAQAERLKKLLSDLHERSQK